VALGAVYFPVFALKLKCSGIMVEPGGFPVFRDMAPFTICFSVLLKLFKMLILVAAGAIYCYS
jgi:hypothetical protein